MPDVVLYREDKNWIYFVESVTSVGPMDPKLSLIHILQDRYLYDYTFANDNGQNPLMDKARASVENWKEAYKNNTGLLLFGEVGTGKSFFAGFIANALLDRDVPVLMTNFPTILNRLTAMFSEDRSCLLYTSRCV